LIDNDDGATDIFGACKQYKCVVNHESTEIFFHLVENLYLIKTPAAGGSTKSCIEDFFTAETKATKLGGKVFNLHKDHDADGEYGKKVFAENVVRPNASRIDFSNFSGILDRIVAVIDHYTPPGG
jgi:hypothetical protein